jgi:L-ascorbate metabolism protein UlaG (beta-lactamase superfamily)
MKFRIILVYVKITPLINFINLKFMYISYHGYCCFSIKGKEVILVTDPHAEELGIKLPKLEADVVTISHEGSDFLTAKNISQGSKVLNWPGEYEIKDVSLIGIPSFLNDRENQNLEENIIWSFFMEEVKFCHLGVLGCKLSDDQLEKIGDVDVLMIPVGGNGSIDIKKAVEVIEQIDPRIVIPMRYALPGIKIDLQEVGEFAKLMGKESFEIVEKFLITKSQLPEESTELIVLSPIHN